MFLKQLAIVATVSVFAVAQAPAVTGTTSFVLDGNRMYAELGFVRPDGSIHRALAFVDMGSATMTVRESLFKDLRLDRKMPLTFKVGKLSVVVPASDVESERRRPSPMGTDLEVEAMLPASVLERFQVVVDYQQRTLALAPPGALKAEGVAVGFHINQKTGLIAVDASIAGTSYPVTIDNGSAYTWFDQNVAKQWLVSHPNWERGVGAVGASNMMMSGDRTETAGTLMRVPEISLGSVILKDVGALAAGPGRSPVPDVGFFKWYSQKNDRPVIGWIGGNVLRQFRLTIDYPNRMTYWLKQADDESRDLDQVGLTLQSRGHAFIVAAVATKNGKPTVEGVLPGDKLLRVGELQLATATWGAIYAAMHGAPGDVRSLTLDRNGTQLTVVARVTAF